LCLRKTRAKLAQNYPVISLIFRSGIASDQTISAWSFCEFTPFLALFRAAFGTNPV
jgi:hypothetical protein